MEKTLHSCSHEKEYPEFSRIIKETFASRLSGAIFQTNAENLFDVFLQALPEGHRQHYNCNSCRSFVNRYGGLVSILENGRTKAMMWDQENVHGFFARAVTEVEKLVLKSKVTGVFYAKSAILGTPSTGYGKQDQKIWHHMSIENCPAYHHALKTPYQESAEKKEDFKNVIRALKEFPVEAIDQAVSLLKTEALYRSEKLLGAAEWLKEVHENVWNLKTAKIKTNLLWRFVALAPHGFCHPRSSMIGTLLEDIVSGLDFSVIEKRFADKMHPLQYQRPQALPSSGNIEQAEKIVKKLGIENSFKRRFARIDEVKTIWTPKQKQEQEKGGIFSNLKTKNQIELNLSGLISKVITWEKFYKTILPEADEILFYTHSRQSSYVALVTANDMDAPPILQWDEQGKRNPVSHYLYNNGSTPYQWELPSNEYVKVNAVCFQPSMWNGGFDKHGKGVLFILDGAKDKRNKSLALFPETLKSELREIRSTIEEFSRNGTISGSEESSACGIMFQNGGTWENEFVVISSGIKSKFKLDRWD